MNILMVTNTYAPMVGGLERSIMEFSAYYRSLGHRVIIVAPAMEDMPAREKDVVRLPAITKLTQANFPVQVSVPGVLSAALKGLPLDLVHVHHPFLIGSTALRLAYARSVPLIFTHHTLFEHYTHFLPVRGPAAKRFMIRLATGYANLCDQVFAPTQSVKELLENRGVRTPIAVVPTGIDLKRAAQGSGPRLRKKLGIPPAALVVGHVGRLGPEKNLGFLSRAVSLFLRQHRQARFLLVGDGPSKEEMRETFQRWGVAERVHWAGVLRGQKLVDAYHAMDLFAFSSKSETQGLVLLEAMAAGTPVVAVKATGVVDILRTGRNGYLLERESVEEFAAALTRFTRLTGGQRQRMRQKARSTAAEYSMERCASRALAVYRRVLKTRRARKPFARSAWARALRWTGGELSLVKNITGAAVAAVEPG